MDFRKLKIKEGVYWSIFIHEDQTVPGRIYFWYKDELTTDLLDVSEDAFLELYHLTKEIRDILVTLFNPSIFNYLVLGNNTPHLHFHLIPRYEKPIQQFGLVFKDTAFGKSYKRNHDFVVSEEILIQIKDLIRSKI